MLRQRGECRRGCNCDQLGDERTLQQLDERVTGIEAPCLPEPPLREDWPRVTDLEALFGPLLPPLFELVLFAIVTAP